MTLSEVKHILTVRRQVMERHRDRIAAAEKERLAAVLALADQ